MMMGHFVGECRRSSFKVNSDKSKMMVLNGAEGSISEVLLVTMQLEHVL